MHTCSLQTDTSKHMQVATNMYKHTSNTQQLAACFTLQEYKCIAEDSAADGEAQLTSKYLEKIDSVLVRLKGFKKVVRAKGI